MLSVVDIGQEVARLVHTKDKLPWSILANNRDVPTLRESDRLAHRMNHFDDLGWVTSGWLETNTVEPALCFNWLVKTQNESFVALGEYRISPALNHAKQIVLGITQLLQRCHRLAIQNYTVLEHEHCNETIGCLADKATGRVRLGIVSCEAAGGVVVSVNLGGEWL